MEGSRLRVAVSGSTGLVGSELVASMTREGHEVRPLVRRAPRPASGEVRWDPASGVVDGPALEGLDAVVHLAGESIAAGRWSEARKKAILDSRVRGTRLLCETLASLRSAPRVVVSASAVGYYGDRGDQEVDESSPPGRGFLPEVCLAWEEAALPARRAGIRVVLLRLGVVLSARGGALRKMLLPFRLGLGGRLGSGRQAMSWIALGDVVGAIRFAIVTPGLAGPVNAVAPSPASNAEFARLLGRVLGRPAVLPAPAALLRVVLGEMAVETLLSGARVLPRRLQEAGFTFRHPDLERTLRAELGR